MAKTLANGNLVPLGKYLLGSIYHLLHQVSVRLRNDQPISNLGSPWWFIQLWLHMYMHKTIAVDLKEMTFPSEEFAEEEETITRRCTPFGEAAIMIANDPNVLGITDFFKCFSNGFSESSTIWFAYHDNDDNYKNPFKFQLRSWKDDEYATKSMKEIISPRILPANFTSGKDAPTFEFYYPFVVARKLGFGQVPPLPFFAEKVQIREAICDALTCRAEGFRAQHRHNTLS